MTEQLATLLIGVLGIAVGPQVYKLLDLVFNFKNKQQDKTAQPYEMAIKILQNEIDLLRADLQEEKKRAKKDGERFYELETELRLKIQEVEKENEFIKAILIQNHLDVFLKKTNEKKEKIKRINDKIS